MDNMTALVSCFARAYHCRNSNLPAFANPVAEQMLTAEEYDAISRNMTQGIQYFAPDFQGTQEEAFNSSSTISLRLLFWPEAPSASGASTTLSGCWAAGRS